MNPVNIFPSLRSILILSSYLHLDCQSGLITSAFLIVCYMPSSSHPPSFDHPIISWWGAQIMNLIIMQFSTVSCYFLPLRPKYIAEYPTLHTLSWYSSLIVRDEVSHPSACPFFFFVWTYAVDFDTCCMRGSTLKTVGQTWSWTHQSSKTLTLLTLWMELQWFSHKWPLRSVWNKTEV